MCRRTQLVLCSSGTQWPVRMNTGSYHKTLRFKAGVGVPRFVISAAKGGGGDGSDVVPQPIGLITESVSQQYCADM